MSRKRMRSRKPLASGVSATPKSRAVRRPSSTLLQELSDAKKATAKNPAIKNSAMMPLSSRFKVVAALALVTTLIAGTAILAQRGKQKGPDPKRSERGYNPLPAMAATNGAQSGEAAPESLTSPSLPSKEYIHGPGGKVIATEEMVTFTDVAVGSPFYDDIYRIAARGVTLGCTATTFCPDQVVSRDQMAAFIIRALGEFDPPTPQFQRFNDVPPSHPFYKFIDRMAVLGITLGCSAGNYCPADLVTHDSMSAFIDRAIGVPNPPTPPAQPTFCDVPTTNVFYAHVEYYANSRNPIIWPGCDGVGLCSPCGTCAANGTVRCFSPSSNVTRRQMAHILVKAFGI